MGIKAVPNQGYYNQCKGYGAAPGYVCGNICGLCLSHPQSRRGLKVRDRAVMEGDERNRRCKPECTSCKHGTCPNHGQCIGRSQSMSEGLSPRAWQRACNQASTATPGCGPSLPLSRGRHILLRAARGLGERPEIENWWKHGRAQPSCSGARSCRLR